MSAILDIIPNIDEEYIEVNLTDETLQCLDFSEINERIGEGTRKIKFYVGRTLKLEECFSILEKLANLTTEDGSISIYTSGNNFNELMKTIKLRKSNIHHELHIDDNNIRSALDVNNIICALNFSRISCDCYFSDRYLVNLNPGDYIRLCAFPECKFDRRRVDKLRSVVDEVWMGLVPSIYSANSLPGVAKVEMVLDYISKRISTTDNYREIRFRDVEEHSRRNYQVDDYADDAVGVFYEKDGTALGKTKLAALLLDNYFAQVDCRVVKGDIFPVAEDCAWLVTRHNGKKYGHSLEWGQDIRFSDLEKLGYVNGVVSLDSDHQYRSDYSYGVDSYSELDEIAYFNLKSSLDNVRSTFVFPPTIISGADFIDVNAYYHNVTPKKNSKLPWLKRGLTVKSAPRRIVDNAHVKRKFPEQFYKRYR